jgi:hypothetical protein
MVHGPAAPPPSLFAFPRNARSRSMFFFFRFPPPNRVLTEARMLNILYGAHCTLVYRFEHVHAIDQRGQEYHICHRAQLTTLDVARFKATLAEALSSGLH